jgi:hypothetical protein
VSYQLRLLQLDYPLVVHTTVFPPLFLSVPFMDNSQPNLVSLELTLTRIPKSFVLLSLEKTLHPLEETLILLNYFLFTLI